MFSQFTRFVGVGILATGIHYAILISLMENNLTGAITASTVGYVVSSIFNYLLNYYFTFSSQERHTFAVLKFTFVAGAGLVLNNLIMYLTVTMANLHYLPGQIMATGLVLIWNFTANRYWTYRSGYTRS